MQYSLLIAGTRSGSGKTSLCLALLSALKARGIKVQACKVGPDFIDPSHHKNITNTLSYNLDAWMGEEDGVKRVYARMHNKAKIQGAQMLLAEGVMGLFDGAYGVGGAGSSAHMAKLFNMPVLLAVDVRGMGQSAVAMATGFTRLQKHINFAGIVCTHVGSSAHEKMLREAFQIELTPNDPPVLGYLPREGHIELKSRHLGLHMGYEQELDLNKQECMNKWIENHLNIDELLNSCAKFPPVLITTNTIKEANNTKVTKRIAIAHDAAFCFLYPDMPDVLSEMGAECVFFSPLKDTKLPANCSVIYLPGGYPELFAKELSENTTMLQSIASFASNGERIYAECGGYIYLMKDLEYAGKNHKLCNVLPISAHMGERKAALGYRQVCFQHKWGRGHEFHYTQSTSSTSGLPPLWSVYDRQGLPLTGQEVLGVVKANVLASWIHLYPEGSRELLAHIFQLNSD